MVGCLLENEERTVLQSSGINFLPDVIFKLVGILSTVERSVYEHFSIRIRRLVQVVLNVKN